MRKLIDRLSLVALSATFALLTSWLVAPAPASPVGYTVGILPGAPVGYLACYPPGAPGPNPGTPSGQFFGPATTFMNTIGVTANASTGRFYVTDFLNNAVDEYPAQCPVGTINAAPVIQIKGPATLLKGPIGVAVDPSLNVIYVANQKTDSVTMYPIPANGNAPPACTLGGPATHLHKPTHIVIEPP